MISFILTMRNVNLKGAYTDSISEYSFILTMRNVNAYDGCLVEMRDKVLY